MFPKKIAYEIQVYITVLSDDGENDADILGMVGASAALCISDIPFSGPMGAVRVARVGGQLVINPMRSQLDESDLDIVVSGTSESIASVEGGAHEISESDLLEALQFGHQYIRQLVELQDELVEKMGKPKLEIETQEKDPALLAAIVELAAERISEANSTPVKEDREGLLDLLREEVEEALLERFPEEIKQIRERLDELIKADMRRMILDDKRRIDGRALDQVRAITCEHSILPRTHGSALFTRGQTQALCVSTLGTKLDERMVDDLHK